MHLPTPPRFTAHAARPLPRGLRHLDPAGALERLRGRHAPWLLESALPLPRERAFSFVGADPYLVLRARGAEVEIEGRRRVHAALAPPGRRRLRAPFLETLRRCLPAPPSDGPEAPFCGGAVGVFGYELADQLEAYRLSREDDLGLPEALWLLVDALLAFDHAGGEPLAFGLGFADALPEARRRAERAAERLVAALEAAAPPAFRPVPSGAPGERSELDRASYRKAVEAAVGQIEAGELYQACLTYRIDLPFGGDPWQLYRILRRRNPAPFAAYLELPELALAGSSPERFLRVDAAGNVESRPIKGTAPRGLHPEEDAARRRALERSEKDRAENLMIVDLVRNDLGRVCEVGSVAVPELMTVEPYADVFQLVSTVTGRLRRGCDALDAVAATFPPGSMTGAPKIAAVRLLDRLESVRRGFYSGALGYLDARGGADLSVVIRTAFARGGRVYLHAGGGIVADSDPAAEHAESRAKLRPLLAALEACEGGP